MSTFQAWLHSIHDLHSHTRQDAILHPRWIGGHTTQRLYCNSHVQLYHTPLQNLLANVAVLHLFSDGLEWPHKKYQTSISEHSYSQKILHTVFSKPKFHIISVSSTLEVSLVPLSSLLSEHVQCKLPCLGKMYCFIWHSDDILKSGGTTA